MTKKLISYCFIGLLLFTILTPTYYSLTEGFCDIELVEKSSDEEEKNSKKSIADFEIKIYSETDLIESFTAKELKKQTTYFSKQYVSAHLFTDTPPPRFIA